MKKRLIGSYYPKCNSTNKTYRKKDNYNGEILIKDNSLVFNRTILLFRVKKDKLIIPLEEIEKVDTCNLNRRHHFGVLITTKDNKEYMLGHINNHKLRIFIMNAKSGRIKEFTKKDRILSIIKKTIITLIILFCILIGYYVVRDLGEMAVIKKEVDKLNDFDYENNKVDMTIYSKYEFSDVEKAIKEYYNDFYKYEKDYYDNYAPSSYNNIFKNYINKNLNSLNGSIINLVKKDEEESKQAGLNLLEMLIPNKSLEYIHKYTRDDYYVDFYKEQVEFSFDKDYLKEWKEEINEQNIKYTYLYKMMDILVNNPGTWYVEDDTIYFYDYDLLYQYNVNYELLYEKEDSV